MAKFTAANNPKSIAKFAGVVLGPLHTLSRAHVFILDGVHVDGGNE